MRTPSFWAAGPEFPYLITLDTLPTRVVLNTTLVGDTHDRTQTIEARTANHGQALDPGRGVHPRNSGGLSRKRPVQLHNHPDDDVPCLLYTSDAADDLL